MLLSPARAGPPLRAEVWKGPWPEGRGKQRRLLGGALTRTPPGLCSQGPSTAPPGSRPPFAHPWASAFHGHLAVRRAGTFPGGSPPACGPTSACFCSGGSHATSLLHSARVCENVPGGRKWDPSLQRPRQNPHILPPWSEPGQGEAQGALRNRGCGAGRGPRGRAHRLGLQAGGLLINHPPVEGREARPAGPDLKNSVKAKGPGDSHWAHVHTQAVHAASSEEALPSGPVSRFCSWRA